jgi:hypothetical protein
MYMRFLILIPKCVFKNILFLEIGMTFPMLMFQIFKRVLLLKVKNFEAPYSCKKLSCTIIF